jgi:hypothetical protein
MKQLTDKDLNDMLNKTYGNSNDVDHNIRLLVDTLKSAYHRVDELVSLNNKLKAFVNEVNQPDVFKRHNNIKLSSKELTKWSVIDDTKLNTYEFAITYRESRNSHNSRTEYVEIEKRTLEEAKEHFDRYIKHWFGMECSCEYRQIR